MTSFDETIKSLTDQAQQLGAMKEQQRIIKLLQDDYKGQDGIIWAEGHLLDLIALINGENK